MSAPKDLRDAIKRDLRPTRPLRPPYVRALVLIPLAVAIVLSVPGLRFFRSDMRAIGFLKAWGFSFGQALAGLVIIAASRCASRFPAAACRAADRRDDRRRPRDSVRAARGDRVRVRRRPRARPRAGGRDRLLPRVGDLGDPGADRRGVARRARVSMRPALAGALYGLGCGLIADAGLRLFCEYTVPGHVLFGHGGAILGGDGGRRRRREDYSSLMNG